MNSVTAPPRARNEPVRSYAPGSNEAASLQQTLADMAGQRHELTMTIAGRQVMASGDKFEVLAPHKHATVLGESAHATGADVSAAVNAALTAAPDWRRLSFDDRAAVFLRAADLISTAWRNRLNAATMLGQSKTVHQAEIDAACELADFLRFNVSYAHRIFREQPDSAPHTWNRMDYRPLEGFVLAITPFNFTAIAANLPTAPALLGNAVVWKPSPTQQLAAHYTMRLLEAAGLPPGVINMVTGGGHAVSNVALAHRDLAGIHFTGSTTTFQHLWRTVGERISCYRAYPRIVGETGGKDFIAAHPSADSAELLNALISGAFEYQGQKCSAASRAYLPRSLWNAGLRDALLTTTESLSYGDVQDFAHFGAAVIDRPAFERLSAIQRRLHASPHTHVIAGGASNGGEGYFIQPTIVECHDLTDDVFHSEYFGPILAVHIYDDRNWDGVIDHIESTSRYALTGSIFARDRLDLARASTALEYAAGNLYINDKPTGAVVNQQPFGGARASGTNDKAGSIWNLIRWVSPRTTKETLVGTTNHRQVHMN